MRPICVGDWFLFISDAYDALGGFHPRQLVTFTSVVDFLANNSQLIKSPAEATESNSLKVPIEISC